MAASAKRILLGTPFPLTVRSLIASGLADELQDRLGAEIHVASPYDRPSYLSLKGREFPNHAVASAGFDRGIPELTELRTLDRALKSVHLTGFAIEYPDGSLQNIELSGRRNPQWFIARGLTAITPRRSPLRKALRRLYARYRPQRASIAKVFDAAQPDLLIVASPGHLWLDHFLLDEAHRRGIPTACIVLSWDNLYSRGPLCRRPDHLMVWSEEMRRQALDVHQFPERRTHVVGAMQFIPYGRPVEGREIAAMRARIGLGDRPYIAYVCGARTSEYDVEDVMALLGALKSTAYEGLQVVVRPHPQGEKSHYCALTQHGVLLDTPPDLLADSVRPDAVSDAEMRHMAGLLKDARFVVSSWGTTALLEACIVDTPSVQLRWMDSVSHKIEREVQLVRHFQRYIHMRAFDEEGARLYCDSPDTLASTFDRLEGDREGFARKRVSTVRRLTALPFEGVPERVCDAIRDKIWGGKC